MVHWQEIVATSSVLSIFLVVLWLLDRRIPPLTTYAGKIWFGSLLGFTTVLGMTMAAEVLPGFKFDLRFAFVSASGLFGGPISALFTGAAAAAFRAYLGGAGTVPGVFSILISAVIGGLGYYVIPAARRDFAKLSVFSIAVTGGVLFSFLTIEPETRYALLRAVGAPILTLTFVTTLCTTLLLKQDIKRKDAVHLNEIYAAMVKSFPDCLNVKDLDGRFIVANDATAYLMRAESAEDLIGKTDFDFYPREVAQRFRKDEVQVLSTGKPRRIEQDVVLRTGEKGRLETVKVPFKDVAGETIGLLTHNREIVSSSSVAGSRWGSERIPSAEGLVVNQ